VTLIPFAVTFLRGLSVRDVEVALEEALDERSTFEAAARRHAGRGRASRLAGHARGAQGPARARARLARESTAAGGSHLRCASRSSGARSPRVAPTSSTPPPPSAARIETGPRCPARPAARVPLTQLSRRRRRQAVEGCARGTQSRRPQTSRIRPPPPPPMRSGWPFAGLIGPVKKSAIMLLDRRRPLAGRGGRECR